MSFVPDDLARKLYETRAGTPKDAWDRVHPFVRAEWDRIASVARTEMMKNVASCYEAVLKMGADDPESAPYRAGIQFVIDTLRKGVGHE
jgi:hypothetical protein